MTIDDNFIKIAGLIAAILAGAFLTFKFVTNKNSNNKTTTNQNNNTVMKGDIVGRDKKVK